MTRADYRCAHASGTVELSYVRITRGEYVSLSVCHRFSPEPPYGDGGEYSVVEIKVHPDTGQVVVTLDPARAIVLVWPELDTPQPDAERRQKEDSR